MPSKTPKLPEPPPPTVRIKVMWFEMSGSGAPGIRALTFLVVFLTIAAIVAGLLWGEGLSTLLQVPGGVLRRLPRTIT